LYYFRARYYHPELGRFLQTDPKGYIDSMNLYQAFGNNPVNFTDPLGTVVAKGIHPEVAMSAYRQFRRGGYSHSIAYKKLKEFGYVSDAGRKTDSLYEFSLAQSPFTDQFSTSPAQIGRDVAAGSINSLVRIVGLAAKAGAHGNTAMSLAAEHVESRVTGGISSALGADEGSLAYWLGETYAPVAAGSAVAGIMGPSSGASVSLQMRRRASNVKNPINKGPLSDDIANTFRSATYKEVTTSEPTTLYRVINQKGNPEGLYWTRVKPEGSLQSIIDSALHQQWGNTATYQVRITVPKGITFYEGFAAPQGALVGGGNQIYIPKIDQKWVKGIVRIGN